MKQSVFLPPVIVSRLILIQQDLSWKAYVFNHLVSTENHILTEFNAKMSSEVIPLLIQRINDTFVCPGNYESSYIEAARMRKGTFVSQDNEVMAVLDEHIVVLGIDGKQYCSTVRHTHCEILLSSLQICSICQTYRNTLRAIVSKMKHSSQQAKLHTNVWYLRTPQRSTYIRSLQKSIRTKHKQLQRLRKRVNTLLESPSCIKLDDDLNLDISKCVNN